jgi:hypothetical protein
MIRVRTPRIAPDQFPRNEANNPNASTLALRHVTPPRQNPRFSLKHEVFSSEVAKGYTFDKDSCEVQLWTHVDVSDYPEIIEIKGVAELIAGSDPRLR